MTLHTYPVCTGTIDFSVLVDNDASAPEIRSSSHVALIFLPILFLEDKKLRIR